MSGIFPLKSARLAHLWESLRTSFWFVPTLMTAGAIGLSFLSVHFDGQVKTKWVRTVGWIWAGSPEGARQVLSTIAGSMITVAGVAFSITIVALTLASSQFGPRLLRSFVRDLGNQVVLGTFVSTFVYCLLVLRTVRGGEGVEFVPYLSVTLGVVFALASLGVLIYFIHHVAGSIQADPLIASVARELEAAIGNMFPEKLSEPGPESSPRGRGCRSRDADRCRYLPPHSDGSRTSSAHRAPFRGASPRRAAARRLAKAGRQPVGILRWARRLAVPACPARQWIAGDVPGTDAGAHVVAPRAVGRAQGRGASGAAGRRQSVGAGIAASARAPSRGVPARPGGRPLRIVRFRSPRCGR